MSVKNSDVLHSQESLYFFATLSQVTSWPVDPSTGLAFREFIVASPYMVRYFSDYVPRLHRLKELVADCAATKEFIWVGFQTEQVDKILQLPFRVICFDKYQPVRCHFSHKLSIA